MSGRLVVAAKCAIEPDSMSAERLPLVAHRDMRTDCLQAHSTEGASSNASSVLQKGELQSHDDSHQTSSSDAAVANALSCSLANIAGDMVEKKRNQHNLCSSNSIGNSGNNDQSDFEQNASTVAVTGSTTSSECTVDGREATLPPLPCPESNQAHRYSHRSLGGRMKRVRYNGAKQTSMNIRSDRRQLNRTICRHFASRTDRDGVDQHSKANDVQQSVEKAIQQADVPALHSTFTNVKRTAVTRQRVRSFSNEQRNYGSKILTKKGLVMLTDNASSSGSGTEGGYAGSASANEDNNGSSSPSVSSSDESRHIRKKGNSVKSTNGPRRQMLLARKQDSCVSSDIADFGSSSSENERTGSFEAAFAHSPSRSPSISSESQDENCEKATSWPPVPLQVSELFDGGVDEATQFSNRNGVGSGKSPLLSVDCNIMAHIFTFLEPPSILDVLTMPLSKDWLYGFTRQPELWRVLCLLDPFKAQVDSNGNDSSDDSDFSANVESELRITFGKHRLLYTSFVRCMRYLARIKDDAVNGRPPSVIDYGSGPATFKNIETNQNLKDFLARARGITVSDNSISDSDVQPLAQGKRVRRKSKAFGDAKEDYAAFGICSETVSSRKRRRDHTDKNTCVKKKKRITFGHSMLTQRMLGPSADGTAGTAVELPWSCAIYSIVNWMVAFSDTEGIQTMCMQVLPSLLDDEQQRITAQRAGLTDIIFRAMVMFPDSSELHTAACHTIVLLARPLGGREGMLFHTSMVNASGIFSLENGGSESGRSGIAVLLDSMRRFRDNDALQAMSCWSLVNVALAPAQKEMLVRLGAIEVTAAAMQTHPFNAEVQFRALFALVNLVIPSVNLNQEDANGQGGINSGEDSSERDILDENVGMIVELVVQSMKNFCASEAILNRACLVLHNLSLTQDYHGDLLWTPNCYQMLEWCLANYPTDQVLQQSAAGTLHRLQITLSGDESMRTRFMASLQSQQQLSLEQAHREAGELHTQVSSVSQ